MECLTKDRKATSNSKGMQKKVMKNFKKNFKYVIAKRPFYFCIDKNGQVYDIQENGERSEFFTRVYGNPAPIAIRKIKDILTF